MMCSGKRTILHHKYFYQTGTISQGYYTGCCLNLKTDHMSLDDDHVTAIRMSHGC